MQKSVWTFYNLSDDLRIRQRKDNAVGLLRNFRGTANSFAAQLREVLPFCWVDIEANDIELAGEQTLGNRRPDKPNADKADPIYHAYAFIRPCASLTL